MFRVNWVLRWNLTQLSALILDPRETMAGHGGSSAEQFEILHCRLCSLEPKWPGRTSLQYRHAFQHLPCQPN